MPGAYAYGSPNQLQQQQQGSMIMPMMMSTQGQGASAYPQQQQHYAQQGMYHQQQQAPVYMNALTAGYAGPGGQGGEAPAWNQPKQLSAVQLQQLGFHY